MTRTLRDIFLFLASFSAQAVSPLLQRGIAKVMEGLGDVPRIGSSWVVKYTEPISCGRVRKIAIDVKLIQTGRYVRGTGHLQGRHDDEFFYSGTIRRNVFYGTFRRRDSHVLAGTGTFVLKIAANSREMNGCCSWYDAAIDDVWSSEYVWVKAR